MRFRIYAFPSALFHNDTWWISYQHNPKCGGSVATAKFSSFNPWYYPSTWFILPYVILLLLPCFALWGPFLECPGSFRACRAVLCLLWRQFAFKIKMSIVLKTIQWNSQLTKHSDWFVIQEMYYNSTGFDSRICLRAQNLTCLMENGRPGQE